MAEYITGIAPLRFHFWIEAARIQAQQRLDSITMEDLWSCSAERKQEFREDYLLIAWCSTCEKKPRKTTAPAASTIKFQLRCWCDRAYDSIKARGGHPEDLQWIMDARGNYE